MNLILMLKIIIIIISSNLCLLDYFYVLNTYFHVMFNQKTNRFLKFCTDISQAEKALHKEILFLIREWVDLSLFSMSGSRVYEVKSKWVRIRGLGKSTDLYRGFFLTNQN